MLKAAMKRWTDSGSYVGTRTTALVLLCAGTGLRVSEALSLDLGQILAKPDRVNGWQIKTRCVIRKEQIKGKKEAAYFIIPEKIKPLLRRYVKASRSLGWVKFPLKQTPIFFTYKTTGRGTSGKRLSKRTAQFDFQALQKMAAIVEPYRFHDLRHTYQTNLRKSGCTDPYKIVRAARLRSIETTMTYVHTDITEIQDAVEKAADQLL